MILKLFTILEKARDPDVQKNTLEILCNLLNPREEVDTDLPSAEAKHVKLLLCYLLHEFKEIQMLGMQLLEQLSQYECSNFHQVMVDCKVVEKMLDILKVKTCMYPSQLNENPFRMQIKNTCKKGPKTSRLTS